MAGCAMADSHQECSKIRCTNQRRTSRLLAQSASLLRRLCQLDNGGGSANYQIRPAQRRSTANRCRGHVEVVHVLALSHQDCSHLLGHVVKSADNVIDRPFMRPFDGPEFES